MSTAGNVTVVLSANTTSFSAALTEAQRNLDKFSGKVKGAGHGTVSSMQAASASIRLLDNPLGANIRAIERLISQSKVLSGVLKAAFPVVGAIAIGAMVAKLGMEVAAFIKQVNEMPKAVTQAFNALTLASVSSADAMRLTNDRLQNEINKLEHKPQNNLAFSIDETRIAADKLATSLQNDANKVKQLLDTNKISFLGSLTGKAGTEGTSGSVNSYLQQIADLGYKRNLAVHSGDTAGADDFSKQIDAKRQSAIKWSQRQLFLRDNPGQATGAEQTSGMNLMGNQAGNRSILLGFQSTMQDSADIQAEENRNAKLALQKAKLDADKTAAEERKKAASEALAAAHKAAADQLQGWESDNSDWKAVQDRSLLDDAAWWKAKLDVLRTSSLNYRHVNEKVNADIIADNRQYADLIAKYSAEYHADFQKTGGMSTPDSKNLDMQGKAAAEYVSQLRASIDLNKSNADAIAESSIAMEVATGRMSNLDAAQALASLHTQQYNDTVAKLKEQLAAIAADPTISPLEKQTKSTQVNNQLSVVDMQRTVQSGQDNLVTNPQGFVSTINDFVNATRDAAGQMREITSSTLTTLNSEFVKGISSQRTDFGNAGASIFRNVASTGIQKAEGSVLGAFGFGGGKSGTKGNPLYVRMADDAENDISQAGSFLSKLFGAGGSSASTINPALSAAMGGSPSSAPIGTIVSDLTSMIPGFAGGGSVAAGTLAMVGEDGPEVAYFGSGANITPNHKLSSVISPAGDTHNWNIDARGATDPAQVKAMVMQGIQQATPGIASATLKSQSAARGRLPPSRRS